MNDMQRFLRHVIKFNEHFPGIFANETQISGLSDTDLIVPDIDQFIISNHRGWTMNMNIKAYVVRDTPFISTLKNLIDWDIDIYNQRSSLLPIRNFKVRWRCKIFIEGFQATDELSQDKLHWTGRVHQIFLV